MSKMEDDTLRSIVLAYIEECVDYAESEIGYRRAACYDAYWQREYGNETEGRSRVISGDVAQHVDTAIPQLIKAFVASDKAVEFVPRKAEDVPGAEQTTDACNYVYYSQNNGFTLTHDCLKDGLLQITGMFKWVWDVEEVETKDTYMGLDDGTFTMLVNDPQVEIIAHSAVPLQGPDAQGNPPQQSQPGQPPGQTMMLHNVTVSRKKESGKVKIFVIPPEEQLIYPRSSSMDVYDQVFIGHISKKSVSDLIEMGYDAKDLEDVETTTYSGLSQEKSARKLRQGSFFDSNSASADDSQRMVDYAECYARVDYDGDGIAELRRICVAGTKVLHNEDTDHIPLAYWTPKIMPHEPVGIGMAEEVYDLQYTKSMLWRQSLDSLYLSVNPRVAAVEGQVNLDDLLTVRPGGVIRMNQPGMATAMDIPFVGQQAFPMMEYLDAEAESRTGVSRLMQAMDPASINKTATGVNALMNAAQARLELIARNFAECAMKPMFRGIVYLLAKHQQEPLIARIRNKFVPIDPRAWQNEYDMTVNVGLGVGTKDQQLQHLMAFGQFLAQVGQTPYAQQLIQPKNVYNYGEKLAELSGFKDVSVFLSNPEGQPPMPPRKPPEVQKAEMQIQADQQKFQAQAQIDQQKMQADSALETQRMTHQAQLEHARMQQEAALETQRMAQEQAFKERELQQQAELERYKAEIKARTELEIGQMRAHLEHQRAMSQPMQGMN